MLRLTGCDRFGLRRCSSRAEGQEPRFRNLGPAREGPDPLAERTPGVAELALPGVAAHRMWEAQRAKLESRALQMADQCRKAGLLQLPARDRVATARQGR